MEYQTSESVKPHDNQNNQFNSTNYQSDVSSQPRAQHQYGSNSVVIEDTENGLSPGQGRESFINQSQDQAMINQNEDFMNRLQHDFQPVAVRNVFGKTNYSQGKSQLGFKR